MTIEQKTEPNSDAIGLDPTSLAAIRNLLATEPEVEPQPVEERQAAKAEAAFVPLPEAAAHAHEPRPVMASAKPSKADLKAAKRAAKAKAKAFRTGDGILDRVKAKVVGYRPTPKHIVLACLTLLIIFRPWLVLGLVFLSSFIVMAIFLILGYDGFWRRGMGLARWYARRRPARSVELHRKLDTFAMKWDAVLDRFPEGSVDGLYLPDFGDLAEAEARHDAALDRRFESLRETEA